MNGRLSFQGLIVLVMAASAVAHDFWVQPSSFRVPASEEVKVLLRVGHAGEITEVARNPDRIEKFIVAGPDGQKDMPGKDGASPAGQIRLDKPGLHVIGFRSKHSSIELEAEKFEGYLREEGLEQIIETRKQRGQSSAPGKELYSRCAKSLVVVGDELPAEADRTLGFRLELIALKSPMSLKPGDDLPLQLLLDGKPCAGALVKLKDPLSKNEQPSSAARTDKDGKASVKLDAPGMRLATAVHMLEAPKDSGADWESLWASLTFQVEGQGAP